MKVQNITRELLRVEFNDGAIKEIEKVDFDKSTITLNTNSWTEIVGEALKKRMALCKDNLLHNESRVLLCDDEVVWFEDGSTFTIGSYEDMENALIKLRDFYDTPQEIFDSMSRWELYQCLKALCGEGLSHEDIQVFDYILHIYTEKVREENI